MFGRPGNRIKDIPMDTPIRQVVKHCIGSHIGDGKSRTSRDDVMKTLTEVTHKIRELSKPDKVLAVGVAGGSCSGKTSISCMLANAVEGMILSMDHYYRGIEFTEDANFDKLNALDLELLKRHIAQVKKGRCIRKPIYDFRTHARSGYEVLKVPKIIIVEGLFALHNILCSELDVRIFVEADTETRLRRRTERDIRERGRTADSVRKQFGEFVHFSPSESRSKSENRARPLGSSSVNISFTFSVSEIPFVTINRKPPPPAPNSLVP